MHNRLIQLIAVLVGVLGMAGTAVSAIRAGESAPDFALRSLQGTNLRLSEYRTDVVVISFWASWCGRCQDALPALNALQQRYAEKGLQVFAVAIEDDPAVAERMARALSIEYPVLLDPDGRASRAYDLGRLPFTVVVDRHGQVVLVDKGFRQDGARQIEAAVAAALEQ